MKNKIVKVLPIFVSFALTLLLVLFIIGPVQAFHPLNTYYLLRSYNSANHKQFFKQSRNFLDDLTVYPAISNLTSPTAEQTEHYAHFAAAAYCNGLDLSHWTCVDCIKAGRRSKIEFAARVYNHTENTMGYFAIDHNRNEIILAFRGTINFMNILQDLTLELTSVSDGNDIKVHKGAWVALMSVAKDVESNLTSIIDEHPTYNRLVLVGHSLGGWLATLALLHLKTNSKFADLVYSLYTYGTARSGNLAFALWVNSQAITAVRVVNNGDSLAHFTFSSAGYVHFMGELWLHNGGIIWCSNKMLEDPNCSNSMGPDYNELDHLIGYWDVVFPPLDCVVKNPGSYIRNFVKK